MYMRGLVIHCCLCLLTDHYPPQRRSMVDKMSPLRWGRGKEETLSEINRKMQRALEETLMKNIHLQQVGHVH